MEPNCQPEIIRVMQQPNFYPHAVQAVRLRETHISTVFLTGDFVYKIKKPVDLDFLDFTTLQSRHRFCRMEVDLNRRLAKDVYLGVVAITRKDGRYYLDGRGPAVEYAVKMRQLPAEAEMVQLLSQGGIDSAETDLLARVLSRFYKTARTGPDIDVIGSWDTIRTNCEENFTQTEEFAGRIVNQRKFQIIRAAVRSFLRRRKTLFDQRVADGKIRDCHGDLRTGHVYFTQDGIQIIDCIEFNERFRYGDISCDLAFLAMDLDFEGYPHIAHTLLRAYAQHSGDHDVFVLLDFYKCYRACVRVKVNCFRLQQEGLNDTERRELLAETRRYLDLAYRYAVQFTRPTVWVVCGLIATGKTTIARSLAGALQINILQSDVVRKQLFDRRGEESGEVAFEAGIYSPEATSLTYGRLLLLAQEQIERGNSVILDASFAGREHRREALRLAKDMDVNIIFIECTCSESLIRERLRRRNHTKTVSDARLQHFEPFKSRFEALDEIPAEILIRVDTGRPVPQSLEEILSGDDLPAAPVSSVTD
jgi:aminoglycoside phosphotransferase family enzyme/predicted kinase